MVRWAVRVGQVPHSFDVVAARELQLGQELELTLNFSPIFLGILTGVENVVYHHVPVLPRSHLECDLN